MFTNQPNWVNAIAAIVAIGFMNPGMVSAQQASQSFRVTVPASAQVVAPPAAAILHDLATAAQHFPLQTWSLQTNSPSGLVAEFSVNESFVNASDHAVKSDAELSIRVAATKGPGRWTTTQYLDHTSHAVGDNDAVVQVTSNAMGNADIELQVRFLNETIELPVGEYFTTVYCTLSMP